VLGSRWLWGIGSHPGPAAIPSTAAAMSVSALAAVVSRPPDYGRGSLTGLGPAVHARPPGATTPGGRLIFHVFAALAEFVRELIVAGTREGLAAARQRGHVGGRPTVMTPEMITAARELLPNPEHSITSIAKLLGVSPGTLYNQIPDLKELRPSRHPTSDPAKYHPRNPAK
jgi:hypothetical protein